MNRDLTKIEQAIALLENQGCEDAVNLLHQTLEQEHLQFVETATDGILTLAIKTKDQRTGLFPPETPAVTYLSFNKPWALELVKTAWSVSDKAITDCLSHRNFELLRFRGDRYD